MVYFGTCSWNYDSWVELVYSRAYRTSAEYLPEYAQKYKTAEIDSWFYGIPRRHDVIEYAAQVPDDFFFTAKVPQEITLTHRRDDGRSSSTPNPFFLSEIRFSEFLEAIQPLMPQIRALIFEFEYLNRQKMPSTSAFFNTLEAFLEKIDRTVPIAIETRNPNFLTESYFKLLNKYKAMHVYSEKLYMPHIYEVYARFGQIAEENCIIRLLGGDRKAIEEKTNLQWNRIVELKTDKDKIISMSLDMTYRGRDVIINVNNHYEGSAPLTIQEMISLIEPEAQKLSALD